MDRAYALFQIKSIDDTRRRLKGVATTPTPDRIGDVIDPLGAKFATEIPLLLHHKSDRPVGVARLQPATDDGIEFEAELPIVDEPGPVRDDVDRAWQSVKHKLIRGVSVGFRVLDDAIKLLPTGGLLFQKTEIVELSLVTIPANQDATLALVKSYAQRAASGASLSGVSDRSPIVRAAKGAPAMQTTAEKITAFEHTRAAKAARMKTIMEADGTDTATLDAAATEEYDGLQKEIDAIDAHLVRLRNLEKLNGASAKPITDDADAGRRTAPRIVSVKANVPKGTGFTRLVCALVVSKGAKWEAAEYATRWNDSTPEVAQILKAAVAPGTTTDATWAGPLAQLQPLTDEFLELLRPATILGRIPGLRRVPFNISIASQTSGGTYQWVGQGAPKPVGKLGFTAVTLAISKAAGIIVISEELARVSNPSAEAVIRQDMINGMAAFLDNEFIDPTKAAVANVSPGSVTNGVTPITSAGTSPANARTDIQALYAAMIAAGLTPSNTTLIMSETNAMALGFALNPLGQPLFPGLTAGGGTVLGLTVITSQAAGNNVIMMDSGSILFADEGGVNIDVSREASLQMDSAPDNPAVATTILTSLWQNNLVGLRAERFINWKKARTAAVQYTVQTYAA